MIQIPLSVSGPRAAFAAALDAHRVALTSHRTGKTGVAAPVAHPLLDSLVTRVRRGDPHPDTFVILPYEIVDDTPKPPPPPTLPEKQHALLNALHTKAAATRDAILSPARTYLLELELPEALAAWEPRRTPAQIAAIAAHTAFQSRLVEITKNVALAAVEIEDLTADNVDTWKVPSL